MFDRFVPSIRHAARKVLSSPATGGMRTAGKGAQGGTAGRRTSAARMLRRLKVGLRLRPMISRADALRDQGRHLEAAAAYEAALEVAPWRDGLMIQCGNMLKDAGRLDEALGWYRAALGERPDDADIHLQTGHALKLLGRRSEALAAYRRVLEIEPTHRHASWELIQAGEIDEQVRGMAAQMTGHGLETMLSLAGEVETMQRRLSEIAAELPDVASLTAFPANAYRLFRQIYDVPPPPVAEGMSAPEVLIVADAGGLDADGLHRLLGSILDQSSPRWRAVVVGVDPALAPAVERLSGAEPRLALAGAALPGRAGALQIAREAAADAVLLPAPGAAIHRHCVAWLAAVFAASEAGLLTCDEEWRLPGESEPSAFEARGGFDPDMLLQENSWGETLALRNEALAALGPAADGEDGAFLTSDLLLAAVRAGVPVGHVPFPLAAFVADEAARQRASRGARPGHRRAVERHLQILGLAERVAVSGGSADGCLHLTWLPTTPSEAITVIVPTRDNGADCAAFVASLFSQAAHPEAVDCLIVDNGTRSGNDIERLEAAARRPGVRLVRRDEAFNWSQLNNRAAAESDAPILVFANDDMEMRTKGWDDRLRGQLQRGDVGAVGAKLLYPDDTVQHAGVLFGWKGSVIHDGLYEPADAGGPSGRWLKTRRVSAVTGAFLAVRRENFEALGGFDAARLPIGYSDLDLCLKLRARGQAVVFTPDVVLTHHESKSRGLDHLDPERSARSSAERRVIEERWGRELFCRDPFVNPLWVDATLPFRLISFPSPRRALEFARSSASADRCVTGTARSSLSRECTRHV
ncbi:glycosyltransferase [Aurantimonas sp. 22II-16-19i]|uniref:tetratricopeptide repeat protein n=1 Tax=Aurantimonas sp. 22II-16-19i TaxID=1317114 RepID=UPI0009F7AE41|nr:glycosyltransferase [Aurantimonas sp. 22II-16-19i]ORE88199.1 family 2 glycosyl transferase [Aurantimonas sp. 22II-16-19i]